LIVTFYLVHKFKWKMIFALRDVLQGLPLIGCLALSIVGLIFLPGTTLHECSHALLVKLIGGKIVEFSLTPSEEERGIELGHVRYDEDVDPFFVGVMGIAPLIFGGLVVFLILWRGLDVQSLPLCEDITQFLETFFNTGQNLIQKPLLIYFLFVFGNGALPSGVDYKDIVPTFVTLLVVGLIAYVVGSQMISEMSEPAWWLKRLDTLILAFSWVLVLDIVLFIPLRILLALFGQAQATQS
jgi:hypothetical protein